MNKYKVFRIIKILFSFLIVVSFFGITIKTTGFDEDDEAYGFEGTVYSKENIILLQSDGTFEYAKIAIGDFKVEMNSGSIHTSHWVVYDELDILFDDEETNNGNQTN